MSALAPVILSPLTVFAVWEIGHQLRDRPGNRRLKPERAEEAFSIIRAQRAGGQSLPYSTDDCAARPARGAGCSVGGLILSAAHPS